MYADRETDSMKKAIGETHRRRALQEAHNAAHDITPKTIEKAIQDFSGSAQDDFLDLSKVALPKKGQKQIPVEELPGILSAMKKEMFDLSEALEFEKAAVLRDRIRELEELALQVI
jgi:excinuclease ABC subunit B